MTGVQGQEAGPFIVRHKRHPEPGARGQMFRDWEMMYVEAVTDWDDRIATLGLYPPLIADGLARQPDGSVVEVERTTWTALAEAVGIAAGMGPPNARERRTILALWNEKHASGSQAGGGTDG